MLKHKLKKYMPDKQKLLNSKSMYIFGNLLHSPNLWHLNRTSVANAFAVGLFFAWIPVPFQMLLAAAGAIIFQANLPLSIAWVWLTNPFTMPPLFYFAYRVGALILSEPTNNFKFAFSVEWVTNLLKTKWQPFLLGCIICAILSAIIGSISIRLIWRYFTVRSWNRRKRNRNYQC